MQAALLLTIGKYLFVALVYLFALMVFRGMMRELARDNQPTQRPRVRPAMAAAQPQPASTPKPAEVAPPRARAPQSARATQTQSRLVVIKAAKGNEGLGAEIALSAAVTFGRGAGNSITLDDRYVSGEHAQIYLREGRRFLRDLGSTNGTLLNDRPIEGEVEISGGDQISIGQTVFEYRV